MRDVLHLTYTDSCPIYLDCHDTDDAIRRLAAPGLTVLDGGVFRRCEGVEGRGPVSARLVGWSAEDQARIVAEVCGL